MDDAGLELEVGERAGPGSFCCVFTGRRDRGSASSLPRCFLLHQASTAVLSGCAVWAGARGKRAATNTHYGTCARGRTRKSASASASASQQLTAKSQRRHPQQEQQEEGTSVVHCGALLSNALPIPDPHPAVVCV